MKVLQSSIFRAVCAIVIGILLLAYPGGVATGLVIAIGILFLVSGAISIATYIHARLHKADADVYDADGNLVAAAKPVFPIVGVGSLLLGLILALMPGFFILYLMYIFGAILILGAINQFVVLMNIKKLGNIPFWFWIFPVLVLLSGFFVMIDPIGMALSLFTIIGIALLVYGITDCIGAFRLHRDRKRFMREMERAAAAAQAPAQEMLEARDAGTDGAIEDAEVEEVPDKD